MHSLLKRQIRKTLGDTENLCPEVRQFIELVNQAYTGFEEDRSLLEHSLELTSRELVERYDILEVENRKLLSIQQRLVDKEQKLQQSVKEKEVLLAEIHHRVKNNLALISSMLYLQRSNEVNDSINQKLHEAQSRIQSMAMIHEMLYQNSTFSEINIARYFEKLIEILIDNFKPEDVELILIIDAQKVLVDIDMAIPLSLLVNELTVNSLKYAFNEKNKGQITFKLEIKGTRMLKLTYSDNGSGIPDKVDLENPTSLGLILINTFIDQLDGEKEFILENGTKISILFPMKDNTYQNSLLNDVSKHTTARIFS